MARDKKKQSEYFKRYYQANRERLLEINKKWNRDHKEYLLELAKKRKLEDPGKGKRYYYENIDKIREHQKRYYAKHKEVISERQKEYYQKNKDFILLRDKLRDKNFPWKIIWYKIRGRCNNPNNSLYQYYGGKGVQCLITKEEIEFLYKRDGAINMNRPSIDRIDSNGSYFLENCRFIEQSENSRRGQNDRWRKYRNI